MKDVAGTGGVGNGDTIGGTGMEVLAVPRKNAVFAECCRGQSAAKALQGGAKSLFKIAFAGETRGKIAADDKVVDVVDQVFDAGIDLVEIGDDGNSCGAGPGSGLGCGGGFETVDVQGARVHDPGAIEIGGLEQEAFIAAAKNGAFASVIHKDERLRAGGICDSDKARIDACVRKFAAMQIGGFVVAQLADIACVESPGLAGDDGGSAWPPGRMLAPVYSVLEPRAGKCARGIRVSIALRPTPTRSTLPDSGIVLILAAEFCVPKAARVLGESCRLPKQPCSRGGAGHEDHCKDADPGEVHGERRNPRIDAKPDEDAHGGGENYIIPPCAAVALVAGTSPA